MVNRRPGGPSRAYRRRAVTDLHGGYGAHVPTVLAVDIGGTKVAAARVDGSGRISVRHSAPTPASADPEEVWRAVEGVVGAALASGPVAACGAGCGGPMGPGGERVSPLNIPAWRGFPCECATSWPGSLHASRGAPG